MRLTIKPSFFTCVHHVSHVFQGFQGLLQAFQAEHRRMDPWMAGETSWVHLGLHCNVPQMLATSRWLLLQEIVIVCYSFVGLEWFGTVRLCRPMNSPLMFTIKTVACVDNPPLVDHHFERGKPQWAFPRGFCMADPWGKSHFWWLNGEILVLVGAIPWTSYIFFSPNFMLNIPLFSRQISLSNTILWLKSC